MQSLACAITLLSVLGWPQVKADDTDAVAIRRLVPSMTAVGAFGGTPPSAPVYQQDRVIAYIFRTRQVIASKGYSGKPLDVLVALDLDGRIVGAEILEHHEPILVIGVLDEDLENFVEQYRGRNIRDPVRVERGEAAGDDSVAAVSGATISSIVLNDTLLRSARAVARSRGILGAGKSTIDIDRFVPETWPALVADGSIRRLGVTIGELQARFAAGNRRYFPTDVAPTDPNAPFLELFAALATPARVGLIFWAIRPITGLWRNGSPATISCLLVAVACTLIKGRRIAGVACLIGSRSRKAIRPLRSMRPIKSKLTGWRSRIPWSSARYRCSFCVATPDFAVMHPGV